MSSINGTTLRLTGMSSGLDTDSIVKSLLEVDQFKVDKQFRLTKKLEWTGNAYRAVNTTIKNFRTHI
jgi:flagellar hook-associated protein 2